MPVKELTPEIIEEALTEVGLGGYVIARVEPLQGGVSNLTFRVDRAGAPPLVIRIQREHGIFEPYDVVREARVLQALRGSAVPVPDVLAVAEESEALGAPFFVMEFVDAPHMGEVPRSAAVTANYVDAVARIHEVPWRETGLSFLGPPKPGLEASARDLAAVNARADRYGHAADPLISELGTWLAANMATTEDLVLCQGDINVFNYLFSGEEVVAVVDWEQAQIGDRQSDLGLLSALSYLLGAQGPPASLPIVADYRVRTGQALESLPYFVLAGLHKLAVIHRIWSAEGDSPPWYTWEQVEASTALVREFAEES